MNVYKITNKINKKCYIGVTTKKISQRWCEHCKLIRSGNTRPLYTSMRKYGKENFQIESIDNTSKDLDELYLKEKYYINKFNSFNKEYGYNLTDGGKYFIMSPEEKMKRSKSMLGKKLSEETKRKISETKKRNPMIITEEYREKIRKTSLGRKKTKESIEKTASKLRGLKRTEEQKNKMRQKHLGKKLSDEHKKNISNGLKGKTNKPFVMYKNGVYLGEFNNIKQFCGQYDLNAVSTSKILLNKITSSKGYTGYRVNKTSS